MTLLTSFVALPAVCVISGAAQLVVQGLGFINVGENLGGSVHTAARSHARAGGNHFEASERLLRTADEVYAVSKSAFAATMLMWTRSSIWKKSDEPCV